MNYEAHRSPWSSKYSADLEWRFVNGDSFARKTLGFTRELASL